MTRSGEIRFGGKVKAERPERVVDPETLSLEEYQSVFSNWVVQCWIPRNKLPETTADLEGFHLNNLRPDFRRRYLAGDWKKVISGHGVTIKEYAICLRLKTRMMIGMAVDADAASSFDLKGIDTILLPSFELGACLIQHLKTFLPEDSVTGKITVPLMLSDGNVGHVVTARAVDDTGMMIGYDEDPTWKGKNSFLCTGQNAKGPTGAKHYGIEVIGEWAVSAIMLSLLLVAIPIQDKLMPTWKEWARQARMQLDDFSAQVDRDNV